MKRRRCKFVLKFLCVDSFLPRAVYGNDFSPFLRKGFARHCSAQTGHSENSFTSLSNPETFTENPLWIKCPHWAHLRASLRQGCRCRCFPFEVNPESGRSGGVHEAGKERDDGGYASEGDSVTLWALRKELSMSRIRGKWKSLSCVWVFATPWPVAHQTPLSMEFSRQEYWSG